LARCLASQEPGDTLLVTKLDRLARSTPDLLNTLAAIGEAGASFRSLGDPWADTTTPHGRLMLTVLGGLAEFERHLILSRTAEGRVRAKARGIKSGRKPSLTVHQRREALARREAGESLVEIARDGGPGRPPRHPQHAIRRRRDSKRSTDQAAHQSAMFCETVASASHSHGNAEIWAWTCWCRT
jgi:DNA invertase Pin-like site-specific DNA recombinase